MNFPGRFFNGDSFDRLSLRDLFYLLQEGAKADSTLFGGV